MFNVFRRKRILKYFEYKKDDYTYHPVSIEIMRHLHPGLIMFIGLDSLRLMWNKIVSTGKPSRKLAKKPLAGRSAFFV